ncbi:AraC family transcriptional regulator [Paenibacillus pedocola]
MKTLSRFIHCSLLTRYTNYSYFSKLFKQEVGLSPNEYKKEQHSHGVG